MSSKGRKSQEIGSVSTVFDKSGNESDSEDDMPEEVSNAAMQSDLETLNKELADLKKRHREEEKAKRRRKQEMFITQKKAKMESKAEVEPNPAPTTTDAKDIPKPTKPTKKVYSAFNVTVEPLTKSDDSRASAALDFKSRRFAAVPRENVKTAVISYKEKLRVRK